MRNRRKGSMLVELCASLAAGSMVMLLGITIIERAMHWTQSMQQQTNLQRELSQLASRWREDLSKADQFEHRSPSLVVLGMPGQEVTYESLEGQVQRRVILKDDPSAKPIGTDRYEIGRDYRARFEPETLVVQALNPAGEVINTRLRVVGKKMDPRYRIIEAEPAGAAPEVSP